ncbi:hypothetical protein ACTM97_09745 [Oliverpabstia intestinalis]|jgi:hypothetical protein|uniref:hypothetical protein n=2 Tax=Oliverpabstia intestinalis TaxID=2606633 RepID=UPI003F8972EF
MEVYTFEQYLKEPYALDFHQMQRIHGELSEEIGEDPEAVELYEELIDAATRYAAVRAKWFRMSKEEKIDTDSLRTSHHDSVITHLNMLARYLKMQGKKAVWREQLGDVEENGYIRKGIGDFACYLVFVNSICAR